MNAFWWLMIIVAALTLLWFAYGREGAARVGAGRTGRQGEPGQLAVPGRQSEPGRPGEPVRPVEPGRPGEPGRPVEPGKERGGR